MDTKSKTDVRDCKPNGRRDPVKVNENVSYYERRNYVEVQVRNLSSPVVIARIPWSQLIESARRCRPEEFEAENAKLRRALQINADFWASAKSEADDGLIDTMRELCSAALANGKAQP